MILSAFICCTTAVFAAAPSASRNAASYQVGSLAVLNLSTSPVEANQPVYRFRKKSGLPDGDQPTLIGHTDAAGVLVKEYVLQAQDVGHYTDEKFSVGSPSGPASSPLSYSVHAVAAPTSVRPAPFPDYEVGQLAQVTISTHPPQPSQKVYRWRTKDGLPDGDQPTLLGWTDSSGVLEVAATLTSFQVGTYTGERYSVGTMEGPKSQANSYTVRASSAPTAVRASPYPSYQSGDTARLDVTTLPSQPYQKVYRWRHRDGQPDGEQPTLIGWTNSNGRLTIEVPLTEGEVGSYTDERFAVGTVSGPTSPSLSYTVTGNGAGAPVITSISTDLLAQGALNRVDVWGENLADASVWVDGAGTLPVASVVSQAADGTHLQVEIDTTAPGIRGYFTLKVSRGSEYDRAAFEVAPPGPAVSGYTPPNPERGETYLLVIFGQNLGDVTVTSSDPDHVRVLAPDSSGSSLQTQPNHPVSGTVDREGALQGLLQIAPDAPLGPVQLLLRDGDGGITAVTLNVTDSVPLNFQQISLTDEANAAAAASKSASPTIPSILAQEFHLDRQPIFNKVGDLEPHADCLGQGSFRAFHQRAAVFALGESGQALTVANMLLGQPYNFELLTIASYFDAEARVYWHCDPPWDEARLDWQISLGFEIVGLFSLEFTVRPYDGRILFARNVESVFDSFSADSAPNDCAEVIAAAYDPLSFSGTQHLQVTQQRCCEEEVPISFEATIFPHSPIAAATLIADAAVVLETEPDEQDCPCLISASGEGLGASQTSCPVSQLFIEEISFEKDLVIHKDRTAGVTEIKDPVWESAPSGQTPKSEPVAYVAESKMEITAKFKVDPPAPAPLSYHIKGTSSEGHIFEEKNVQVTGSEVEVTLVADVELPKMTKHFDPMTIEWEFSEDRWNFYSAGKSKHEIFVTYNDPIPALPRIYLTILHLAIGSGGAASEKAVVDETWAQFSTGNGPAHVKTWLGAELRYYPRQPQPSGFGPCANSIEGLLITTRGQCGAFVDLFGQALAINGIASIGKQIQTNDGHFLLVREFIPLRQTPTPGGYRWLMKAYFEAGGIWGMVPDPPAIVTVFGDLKTDEGLPGQNSLIPSEKLFARHFAVEIPSVYPNELFDPSYGTRFPNLEQFKTSLFGYGAYDRRFRKFRVRPTNYLGTYLVPGIRDWRW